MAKKKSKKWILEHYECDGQLSIDDLHFTDKNVDNSINNVDYRINWDAFCTDCVLTICDILDKAFEIDG